MTSKAFLGAAVVVVAGAAASLAHTAFVFQSDGFMSPKTAAALKLIDEKAAPFSSGLAYKKDPDGGYKYREAGELMLFSTSQHTDVDLAVECKRLGGCEKR